MRRAKQLLGPMATVRSTHAQNRFGVSQKMRWLSPFLFHLRKSLPYRLALARHFTVAKRNGILNEDYFDFSNRLGRFALCDGASVSFDSRSWAKIIAKRYIQHPKIDSLWLSRAATEFSKLYDRDSLPWMKQAAFDNGSFSSILAIEDFKYTGFAKITAIGDTTVFLYDGAKKLLSYPYTRPEEYDRNPLLLSTNNSKNTILFQGNEHVNSFIWNYGAFSTPIAICATDALSRWIMEQETYTVALSKLLRLRTDDDFKAFVLKERDKGALRVDDTSMLILRVV